MRREEDRLAPYNPFGIDRHSVRIFLVILLLILLSIVDAALTLELVNCGAEEVNPVMAYYLNLDPVAFFGVKYLLTCAPILIILINKNVYLFRSRIQAKALFIPFILSYLLVIHWELYLILFEF